MIRLTEKELQALQARNIRNNQSQINPLNKLKIETDYANRGMTLEDDLNSTNEYYLTNKIAVIHKKPTPIQIVKVEYPKKKAPVIKEAYFRKASTTDYNGLYKGKYIDFEAKETENKTSFPLSNFGEHQIQHMNDILMNGGISFAIIRFTTIGDTYLLDASHIISFWNNKEDARKSIPKLFFDEHGHLIKLGYMPILDYISVIQKVYF